MAQEKLLPQVATHDLFGQFRFIKTDDGEILFVAADVCKILGLKNHRDAVSRLDDDEKDCVGNSDAIGRIRKTLVINESGLYSLIFMSHKPEAKKFRKWVTSEVLPSIRKTGSYSIAKKFVEENQDLFIYEEFDNGEFEITEVLGATIEYDENGEIISIYNDKVKLISQ